MCGLGYHGLTSSAPENCAPGPRKGADPLVLISPQPSSVLPSRTEQMLHDLFRVEGLLTENPRNRHSQEERTKLDGLTWRKNSPLACFLGPWYTIKKKKIDKKKTKKNNLNAFKFFLHTMTHQTKGQLGNQDHQFLGVKHGQQTTKQWLPRSNPAEVSPCLREGQRLPA